MLCLLGSICILGGTVGLGIHYVEKEKQRIQGLEKWEYITELYISEITYKKQPLSLASIEVGKKIQGTEGEILCLIGEKLRSGQEDFFSDIWKKEWKCALKKINLTKEEKDLVMDFQIFTGFENEEVQKKMIMVQQEKWKKIRERVQEESREKKRITLLLSLFTGILMVLILL